MVVAVVWVVVEVIAAVVWTRRVVVVLVTVVVEMEVMVIKDVVEESGVNVVVPAFVDAGLVGVRVPQVYSICRK